MRNTCIMLQNAFKDLDYRKWFDRMQPQTLSIATILLYIDGVFAFLRFLDRNDVEGYLRAAGGMYALITIACIIAFPSAGFFMANGKLLGWYFAVLAAFSPFVLRMLFKFELAPFISWRDVIVGSSYVGLMFEAALVALVLHPMSRNYAKSWLR